MSDDPIKLNPIEKFILKKELQFILRKVSTMTITWHIFWQGLALVVQAGNQYSGMVPDKAKPYVALAVGLGQAALAWYAHYKNPDGTPAEVAYVKK